MTTVEPIKDKKSIEKVKCILKESGNRDYLLFTIGINSGLRISDVLKLKVKDVRNKEFIELYEQKTKKFKKIPITNYYKYELENFVLQKNDSEWLFPSKKGKNPITRVQAYRIIKKACTKAGINSKIGTHTLRKTFGYHFYQKEKDIALLQYIFNHSNQAITLRYIGITEEMINLCLKDFGL